MSLRQFYITLPSNVKSNTLFEYNTIASYKTLLKKRIELPRNEVWEAGLAEISYTKSWYNVTDRNVIDYFDMTGESIAHSLGTSSEIILNDGDIGERAERLAEANWNENARIYLKPGFYKNCEALCSELNRKLEQLRPLCECVPELIFDDIDHRVTLKPGKSKNIVFYPDFGLEASKILGLIDYEDLTLRHKAKKNSENNIQLVKYEEVIIAFTDEFSEYRGTRVSEMNASLNSIYIWSNIVQHCFVGDAFAQLLRVVEVPTYKEFGDLVTITYNNPHFMPLQTNIFDTIDLELTSDTGEKIPFEFGRVVVKLLIRKHD